jgi:uncharacterized membrane protein
MTPEASSEKRRVRAVRAAVICAAAAFVAGTFAVPLLERAGVSEARFARLLYAPLCHQSPERSLLVGGEPQAVCARCAGLYLGGLAGLAVGPFAARRGSRPRPSWLGWAALPTLVDVALAWIGLAGAANLPRLALGVPLGLVAGAFLAAAIEDGCTSGFRPAGASLSITDRRMR